MPTISNRGKEMPESPIRKLAPSAAKATQLGRVIYHLNIGQPDIETPQAMIDAMHNLDMKVIAYSPSQGFESYRKKVVEFYRRKQIADLSIDDVMVTTGGSEALTFSLFSCLDQGDEVIIPEPFYANYNGFATAGNIVVKPLASSIEENFALPPISDFEKVITPKTKAILICNPGNPTGCLYNKEELLALRDLVLKHDLFLFADEVYREFVYDGQEHTSILSLDGLEENAVVIDSISKRYSACGARLGTLLSRNRALMSTALKFAQARLSPPTLAQVVAEAGIMVEDAYFEAIKAEYVSRRDMLVAGLNEIPGVFCPTPGGAFYAMVRLPIDNADKFCKWLLEEFEHNNETVMLAPGSGFYATEGRGLDEVRIAYVLNKDSLSKALEILKRALAVYPGRVVAKQAKAEA